MGSIESSLYSIGLSYDAMFQGGWSGTGQSVATLQDAYDAGPLGQTQHESGVYYYGTRGALVVSTGAMLLAGVVEAAIAAGCPTFSFAFSSSHVAFGVTTAGETAWFNGLAVRGGSMIVNEYFAAAVRLRSDCTVQDTSLVYRSECRNRLGLDRTRW